jgi:predicted Fe-Mo cluster-binding NifX family protein
MKVRGKANQAQLAAQAAQMAVKYGPQAIELAKKHGPAMVAAVTKAAEEYKAKKGKANNGEREEAKHLPKDKLYKKKKAEKIAHKLEKQGVDVTIYP